jgi:hypothetical protein
VEEAAGFASPSRRRRAAPWHAGVNAAITVRYAPARSIDGMSSTRVVAMAQLAEQVYTEQRDIARIESWVEQLPDEAIVTVKLADGGRVQGVVWRHARRSRCSSTVTFARA